MYESSATCTHLALVDGANALRSLLDTFTKAGDHDGLALSAVWRDVHTSTGLSHDGIEGLVERPTDPRIEGARDVQLSVALTSRLVGDLFDASRRKADVLVGAHNANGVVGLLITARHEDAAQELLLQLAKAVALLA